MTNKRLKIHQNGGFDLWTCCPKINCRHFHPWNPVRLPPNTCSVLFCGIYLTNVFVHLVAFGNIMGNLENRNSYDQQ